MNRRDFLTFRVERRLRVAELSCERLYMLLLDSHAIPESPERSDDEPWLGGEPEAVYHRRSAGEIFEQLDRDLDGVDVIRVRDREWLAADLLVQRLDRVLTQFRARGGRVEALDAAKNG